MAKSKKVAVKKAKPSAKKAVKKPAKPVAKAAVKKAKPAAKKPAKKIVKAAVKKTIAKPVAKAAAKKAKTSKISKKPSLKPKSKKPVISKAKAPVTVVIPPDETLPELVVTRNEDVVIEGENTIEEHVRFAGHTPDGEQEVEFEVDLYEERATDSSASSNDESNQI